MNTTIHIELPGDFQQAISAERGEASLPRWALEALVLEAVREGIISRGRGGEILGLDFHGREAFYASRGLVYDMPPQEVDAGRRTVFGG